MLVSTRSFFFAAISVASFSVLVAACNDDPAGTYSAGGGPTTSTSSSSSSSASSSTGAAGAGGTGGAAPVDKAAACASMFGQALTAPYGRLDGTVLAVVKPTDTQCPMPNSDHLILQVTMNGEAYRMVINIQSTVGDPNVQYLAIDHALVGPAWSEGWHTGIALDYVQHFGVHAGDFTPHPLAELADVVTDAITLGQKVSVFAQTTGGSSAHQIHRNGSNVDGAVVLDADGPKPRVLLFHFADQTF
jgi:hypothetical protein